MSNPLHKPMQRHATGRNIEKSPPSGEEPKLLADIELTQQQQNAIELLLQGLSDAQTAEQVGVNRATVYRWRTLHAPFRIELDRRRRQLWQHAADRMRAMIQPALDILQQQLNDPRTALRAAATVLRLAAPKQLQPSSPTDLSDEKLEMQEIDDLIEASLASED